MLPRLMLGAALLTAGLLAQHTRHHGQQHFLVTQRYEDIYYLPPPEWLGLFSLGHREALADLIWLHTLVYFGEELGQRGGMQHLYRYADAMLALDPYFKKVYSWVAGGAIYRTGHVDVDDAWKAIAYLEAGVRRFPDDGQLAWELGANYSYELVPMLSTKEEKDEARRRGIEHLRVAALHGAGPPWLALSVATGFERLGHLERQIAHLEEVYPQINDPKLKERIMVLLARLRDSAYAEALKRTTEELEANRQRDFPYLPSDLYLLLGSRPPFDGNALRLRGFDPEAKRFEPENETPENEAEDATPELLE